jgi:hypothetical protein
MKTIIARPKTPRSRSRLFLEHKGIRIYYTHTPRKKGTNYATWLSMRADTKRNCYKPGIVFAPTGLKTWLGVPLDQNRMKDHNGHYYDDGYRYGHEADYVEAAKAACRRAIDAGMITKGHAPEDAQ